MFLIIIFSVIFIGIISYFLSDFDMRIVLTVSMFSVIIMGICFVFVKLISKNVNNTLEALSQTIESIIYDNPTAAFSDIEDTMLSKLQNQILKLSDILKSHSIRQKKEKDAITELISDISH